MTIEQIKNHPVMIQILADSYGGIMYDVANRDKYDTTNLLESWDKVPAHEKENAGGIINGAINFLNS